jgi:hypothetical protein
MPGIPGAILQTLFVLFLVGAWIFSLFSALNDNRRGIIGALICTSIPVIITLYDLILYSPSPYGWPLLQISIWVTFFVSLLATGTLTYQLYIFKTPN